MSAVKILFSIPTSTFYYRSSMPLFKGMIGWSLSCTVIPATARLFPTERVGISFLWYHSICLNLLDEVRSYSATLGLYCHKVVFTTVPVCAELCSW